MSVNKKVREGAKLVPFTQLFQVEPKAGNKGPLLLRKDNFKDLDGNHAIGLTATMFFACGMVYGATITCRDEKHQRELFDAFSQEDAEAIARTAYKDVEKYLLELHDGKEVNIVPTIMGINRN